MMKFLLAFLYAMNLTYWAMTSLFGDRLWGTLAILGLLQGLFFVSFRYFKKMGRPGTGIFILASVIYFWFIDAMIQEAWLSKNLSYQLWIFSTNPHDPNVITAFWLISILLLSYVFAGTTYYFTVLHFRMPVLLLIAALAFTFNASKGNTDISLQSILFIMTFFALYVEKNRSDGWNETIHAVKYEKSYFLALGAFILLSMLLAFVVPKPNTIPKIASLESTIQPISQSMQRAFLRQSRSAGVFNPMGMQQFSYIGSFTQYLRDIELYTVQSSEPLYFKVQSFDQYVKNRWEKGSRDLYVPKDIAAFTWRPYQSISMIAAYEKSMGEAIKGLQSNQPKNKSAASGSLLQNKQATIYPKNLPYRFFLIPPGTLGLSMDNQFSLMDMNESGILMPRTKNSMANSRAYRIDYVSTGQSLEPALLQFLKLSHRERVANLLLRAEAYALQEQEKVVLRAAKAEMETAYAFYTQLPEGFPQRIQELARAITKDKKSDFEKAKAIEAYFHSSDFEYSLYPTAAPREADYNEFFLFESKKGICIHYASAMTLLARAAGLPARYVEGYVAREKKSESGMYVIREKDGHAFPEVYIAGFGWMVFEPTVSMTGTLQDNENAWVSVWGNFKDYMGSVQQYFGSLPLYHQFFFFMGVLLMGMGGLIVSLQLRKYFWKKRLLQSPTLDAFEDVFGHVAHHFASLGFPMQRHETPLQYAHKMKDKLAFNLENIAHCYNAAKYGGIQPTREQMEEAVKTYDLVVAIAKKKRGHPRSWFIV